MSSTSTPNTPAPKTMSSRLLTMKFMQRAASSPTSSSPSTPDEPPSKRRKKDSASSPMHFSVSNQAVREALADEEAKRQAALERQAAEAGDTRWVLSFEDQKQVANSSALSLRVVQTGYANLDSLSSVPVQSLQEDAEDKPAMIGRRSYGKFNKYVEKQQQTKGEDSLDSESDEGLEESGSSDESDNDDENSREYYNDSRENEAIRRLKDQRKDQKKKAQAALLQQAKDRKKKEINLNGLTSLSGRQGGPCHHCGGPHLKKECPELAGGSNVPRQGTCYHCGGPHLKRECPELPSAADVSRNKRTLNGRDDGPPRKAVKVR